MRAVRDEPTAAERLRDRLAAVLGDSKQATRFLRTVLADAGTREVPEDPDAYGAFLETAVIPHLLATTRLDAVQALLDAHAPARGESGRQPVSAAVSPKIARRARVLLVECDAVRRAELGRALVRDGCDVEPLDEPGAVLAARDYDVVVMALDERGAAVADALAQSGTRAGLVTWDVPGARQALRRLVATWPNDRLVMVSPASAAGVVVARVRMASE